MYTPTKEEKDKFDTIVSKLKENKPIIKSLKRKLKKQDKKLLTYKNNK